MNSMTGFGRSETELDGQKLSIEIKTVNHRFLDLNIRMPKFLLFLDEHMRSIIKSRLARGHADVYVTYTDLGGGGRTVRADVALVKAYLAEAERIGAETGVMNDLTMTSVVRLPDVMTFEDAGRDEDALRQLMTVALEQALGQLTEARAAEGERICQDIFARLDALAVIIERIAEREPVVVEEYRERLKKRLTDLLAGTELDENRFNTEIVFFADKCSITEEIVRVRSHIKQCRETLSGESAAGRSIDFVVQELNREFNTIGSKSQDIDITKLVLEAKTEVERIREQIQNIE